MLRSRLKWNRIIVRKKNQLFAEQHHNLSPMEMVWITPFWWVIVPTAELGNCDLSSNKIGQVSCGGITIWFPLGVDLARALLIEIVPVVIKFWYRYSELATFPCPQKNRKSKCRFTWKKFQYSHDKMIFVSGKLLREILINCVWNKIRLKYVYSELLYTWA